MNHITFPLKYTICFCIVEDSILVILRNNEPNKHKWNGLGGKIENGETPEENIIREVKEEAEIDLQRAKDFRFTGIVSWKSKREEGVVYGGMYAYIAHFSSPMLFANRDTREGLLSWKKKEWLCDFKNDQVAENIPFFLPAMMSTNLVQEYACTYQFGKLVHFTTKPLREV